MNKTDARKIAEIITNEELLEMFERAKADVLNWKDLRSDVNSSFTKGAIWNILGKNFDVNKSYHVLAKKNMIWEFGDYLPDRLKLPKQKKSPLPPLAKLHHREPDFGNYK